MSSQKSQDQRQSYAASRPGMVPPPSYPARPRRGSFEMRVPERRQVREKPRVFLLKWNNAHVKTLAESRFIWHECWGTLYPNGKVTLDYGGTTYDSMGDLRDHVSQTGVYLFQWLELSQTELGAGEGTALSEGNEG